MHGIGGNTECSIQIKTVTTNAMGGQVKDWRTVQTLRGWLDLSGGEARYGTYNAKIQESTHVFVADYTPLDGRIAAETARAIIDGKHYDITLMDNPMGLGKRSQWEIFLKYTGGQ